MIMTSLRFHSPVQSSTRVEELEATPQIIGPSLFLFTPSFFKLPLTDVTPDVRVLVLVGVRKPSSFGSFQPHRLTLRDTYSGNARDRWDNCYLVRPFNCRTDTRRRLTFI